MATKVNFYKWEGGHLVGSRQVVVPRCPMFDFGNENETDEVKALRAEGFTQGGHVDGVEG